nr:MAG: putative GTPase [Candidatus Nanosalinarum sp. J07AB56]
MGRQTMASESSVDDLEEKLEETPVNKATEKERARLKSKIAKLKEKQRKAQKGTGDTSGYAVRKRGDATAALVGFPSVGKSSLLSALTNADPETGAYEFTTLDVEPGTLQHRGANIQVLDVPGLIGGAAQGRGDGTQVLSVVRNADLVVEVFDPEEMRVEKLEDELRDAGIRMDATPPDVTVEEKESGGISVSSRGELDEDTIRQMARNEGYVNANVVVREPVDSVDRLVDGFAGNRRYMPSLRLVNKSDGLSDTEKKDFREDGFLPVSAETGENLDVLRDRVFDGLNLIRVYMKRRGEVDREEPLILREGETVEDALGELPGDMAERFKSARVTGESSDFPEQKVGKSHELMDEDVLSLNLKRV